MTTPATKKKRKPIWEVDSVRPTGQSKSVFIDLEYDVIALSKRHLNATATVRNKKTKDEETGWTFKWIIDKEVVGSTKHLSIENVHVTVDGFVPLIVEAWKEKHMVQKAILLFTKKSKVSSE